MNATRQLSILDYVFTALSGSACQFDFAIVLYFKHGLDLEALNAGAASARRKYPKTSSIVYRNRWEYVDCENCIEYMSLQNSRSTNAAIKNFLTKRFDLRVHLPYSQLLISTSKKESILVTRFDHAVADGISAAMWLSHQLSVAFGLIESTPGGDSIEPQLKTQQMSVRRSRFAYEHSSAALAGAQLSRSGIRRWVSFEFCAEELKAKCRRAGGFTYNDLLATCALETFVEWNRSHNQSSEVGLWFPLNVRRTSVSGFGNGTSRIRLYPRYEKDAAITEKARAIRTQIKWCIENGEWVIPNTPWLRHMPRWITRPAMMSYLNRSTVDMGTGVFTHIDSRASGLSEVFQSVDRVECIGLLHPRQAVAFNGTTHRGKSTFTLTYDSGLLSDIEAVELTNIYQDQVAKVRKEFFRCAA